MNNEKTLPQAWEKIESVQTQVVGFDEKIENKIKQRLITANTIEQLKTMDSLKEDDIVEVLGYYQAGDGAGHKRKLESEDDGSGVLLDNGLYANIVHNGEVNVSWFGAKGDGITDDALFIQKAIDTADVINFQEKTYLITVQENIVPRRNGCLLPKSNNILNFNFATLKINNPKNLIQTAMLLVHSVNSVKIYNGKLIGDRATNTNVGEWGHGIFVLNSQNIEIHGMNIVDMFGDGIDIDTDYDNEAISEKILISNCIVSNTRRDGIGMSAARNVTIEGCYISNTNGTAPQSCIDVETNHFDRPAENIKIINNTLLNQTIEGEEIHRLGFVNGNYTKGLIFSNNYTDAITIFNYAEDVIISDNIFKINQKESYIGLRSLQNVMFSNNSLHNFSLDITHKDKINNDNIKISNNIFKSNLPLKYLSITQTTRENTNNLIIDNNTFDGCKNHALYFYSEINDATIKNNKIILEQPTKDESIFIRSNKSVFSDNEIIVKSGYNFSGINYLVAIRSNFVLIKNNLVTLLENPLHKAIFDTDKYFSSEPGECDIAYNKIISDFEFRAIQMYSESAPTSALYNDFRNCNLLVVGGNLKYNVGNILKETIATQEDQKEV